MMDGVLIENIFDCLGRRHVMSNMVSGVDVCVVVPVLSREVYVLVLMQVCGVRGAVHGVGASQLHPVDKDRNRKICTVRIQGQQIFAAENVHGLVAKSFRKIGVVARDVLHPELPRPLGVFFSNENAHPYETQPK